jgi:hypothetical protein
MYEETFNVDDKPFREAKVACGATTDTETVRLGLEALVRHAAYERLRALRGREPRARDVPRRRERPAPKRRKACTALTRLPAQPRNCDDGVPRLPVR